MKEKVSNIKVLGKKTEAKELETIRFEYDPKTEKFTSDINASNDIILGSIIDLTVEIFSRTGISPDLVLTQVMRNIAQIQADTELEESYRRK